MKNLLQLLVNLVLWWSLTITTLLGILWYGKLPKVSLYHWNNNSSLYKTKDIYNDVNCQVKMEEDVPQHIKERIVSGYINTLFENKSFKANVRGMNIPIFDGKEVIGSSGINPVLQQAKVEYLKS